MEQDSKPMIQISVRNLVEFILRSGDIDNRRQGGADNAMAEGSRIHRAIQRRMGANYYAEVFLRHVVERDRYRIVIEGRADGIIKESYEGQEDRITIDEIKSTYRDLSKIKEAVCVHIAQAKCYAYLYLAQENLSSIQIRLTYCNIETEELKYFYEEYTREELTMWFDKMIEEYQKWANMEFEWKEKRQESIKNLLFPFPYREGQKELITYVYQTIYHKKKLFLEAPTGVGKTISTLFPAIKAVGEGFCDKIFYLTAKTITASVAKETYTKLRNNGLCYKTTVITAKEKICPLEEAECNPDACPYAKGHFDRINDAIYELLQEKEDYVRETIEEYAQKHRVCPFEMSLDLTLFSDGIICDYNYLFDPHVYLKRFFSDGVEGNYLFLIDEAHNLLDRGREMYSAILRKEDFLALKKVVKDVDSRMEKNLEKCNKEMLLMKRECENYEIVEYIDPFVTACNRLYATMDKYLQDHEDSPIKREVLEFYFEIRHFLDIYERVDENYVTYTEMQADGSFIIKLFCVNPAINLKECMAKGRSSILFSATLLPIQYYKKLLGGEETDYEVYAKSTFAENKKALLIGSDVTTKYTRRTQEEFYKIASYLHEIIKNRHGNYMVFFPSHSFLQQVYDCFMMYFQPKTEVECMVQADFMKENMREEFLKRFESKEEEKSLLGFCVLGGIFSEGIDLKEDRLIGSIIVGTGIPQVCNEREIVKQYFEEANENGFDYAYRYPGMNKVLQAAGRVIRTADDVGIVVLLDERFLTPHYQRMFPREWEELRIVNQQEIAKKIERFWDEWL